MIDYHATSLRLRIHPQAAHLRSRMQVGVVSPGWALHAQARSRHSAGFTEAAEGGERR